MAQRFSTGVSMLSLISSPPPPSTGVVLGVDNERLQSPYILILVQLGCKSPKKPYSPNAFGLHGAYLRASFLRIQGGLQGFHKGLIS